MTSSRHAGRLGMEPPSGRRPACPDDGPQAAGRGSNSRVTYGCKDGGSVGGPSALLLAESLVDLLLDVLVVLVEQLGLVLGQDPERDPHDALRELHVEPVLAVRDPVAGDLEEEPADAGALVAQLDLVPGERALVEVGEEADAASPVRVRREVVDRVALDLLP